MQLKHSGSLVHGTTNAAQLNCRHGSKHHRSHDQCNFMWYSAPLRSPKAQGGDAPQCLLTRTLHVRHRYLSSSVRAASAPVRPQVRGHVILTVHHERPSIHGVVPSLPQAWPWVPTIRRATDIQQTPGSIPALVWSTVHLSEDHARKPIPFFALSHYHF